MTKVLIVPYRPENWTGHGWTHDIDFQVDPAVLLQAMRDRWPDASVDFSQLPETSVEWNFPSHFWGHLQSNCQAVSVTTGPKQSLIEFVLWYREFIDPSIRLFLMNEWSEETLELTLRTSADEITDFVGY